MAENEEDYSSSTSEDDVDSLQSLEEDIESVPDQIAPYEGEPLASSDDNGEGLNEEDEGDEDGLTASILERRFEKTVSVSSWYLLIPLFCSPKTFISKVKRRFVVSGEMKSSNQIEMSVLNYRFS